MRFNEQALAEAKEIEKWSREEFIEGQPKARKAAKHPEGVKKGDILHHVKGKYTVRVDKVYSNGRMDLSVIEAETGEFAKDLAKGRTVRITHHKAELTGYKVFDVFEPATKAQKAEAPKEIEKWSQ